MTELHFLFWSYTPSIEGLEGLILTCAAYALDNFRVAIGPRSFLPSYPMKLSAYQSSCYVFAAPVPANDQLTYLTLLYFYSLFYSHR